MKAITSSKLDTIRSDIDTQLARYYGDHATQAGAMHEDYAMLWRAMESIGASNGKRLRPYVMLIAYEGLGGDQYSRVLPVAVALEVLHASLLIHDDIIDHDYVRYGQPNVAGQYRERYTHETMSDVERDHYANSAALLAGDLALSGAYELILGSSLSADTKVEVARALNNMIFAEAGGELLDTEAVFLPFEGVDTMTIAHLKTAVYSFVGPLLIAAILAGADNETKHSLEDMGYALGIAYQLADDVLGLFGDEAVTGKSSIGDLKEGKRTFIMQRTFALATSQQLQLLEAVVGREDMTQKQADEVRQIVRDSGALAETKELMSNYAAQAKAALLQVPLKKDVQKELSALIEKAIERQS
jgi:geranylgeranyl diphosphate synthase type II